MLNNLLLDSKFRRWLTVSELCVRLQLCVAVHMCECVCVSECMLCPCIHLFVCVPVSAKCACFACECWFPCVLCRFPVCPAVSSLLFPCVLRMLYIIKCPLFIPSLLIAKVVCTNSPSFTHFSLGLPWPAFVFTSGS